MGVHSLVQAEANPDVHGEDVQVLGHVAVEKRTADRAHAEDEDLKWVGKLCCEAEWCAVAVVQLVDVAVQRAVVQSLMCYLVGWIDG